MEQFDAELLLMQAVEYIETFDCHPSFEWVKANEMVPYVTVAGYLVLVFFYKMSGFEGKGFKGSFAKLIQFLWNLMLAVFSTAGVAVCVPYLINTMKKSSLESVICSDAGMWEGSHASCYGAMGFFMTAFMFSKFPELGDTLLLMLMGRKVVVLQWYHHATVLLYCWFAYSTATPNAMLFGTLNYIVHSVMYTYFAVSCYSGILSPIRKLITLLQLSQMAIGFSLNIYTYYLVNVVGNCSETYSPTYFTACGLLYASYFVLFLKLYLDSYSRKNSRKPKTN
eukprot:TRINITY_DN5905_c2_g1_i1.p1 TRINITY_DN5905_c2_g1~~TRINITY_DN5905_c2_g1_i1.p1  ORF type:complete len:281 (+),score=35.99 TRINITY_DN5905_c2_g1_i1:66-908(+)